MFKNIPYFRDSLPQDLQRVNQVSTEQVRSDVVLIEQIGQYIIGAGGKRLRPITAILSGRVLETSALNIKFKLVVVRGVVSPSTARCKWNV